MIPNICELALGKKVVSAGQRATGRKSTRLCPLLP